MSKINETKNHVQNVMEKLNERQRLAFNGVIAWNDKVGNHAANSMTETVELWKNSLIFSFKSLDIVLEPLSSLNEELDKTKIKLQSIRNELDTINKNVNGIKEFL